MIRSFRHRGLRQLWLRADARRLPPALVERIRSILAALDGPIPLQGLSRPTFRLHPLRGDRRGLWSVRVSANWRIVSRIEGSLVFDIDLIDYH